MTTKTKNGFSLLLISILLFALDALFLKLAFNWFITDIITVLPKLSYPDAIILLAGFKIAMTAIKPRKKGYSAPAVYKELQTLKK